MTMFCQRHDYLIIWILLLISSANHNNRYITCLVLADNKKYFSKIQQNKTDNKGNSSFTPPLLHVLFVFF